VLSLKIAGISNGINKNAIIKEYMEVCQEKEGFSHPVASSNKGEPNNNPTTILPLPNLSAIAKCSQALTINIELKTWCFKT
jgi:hypothetical protein